MPSAVPLIDSPPSKPEGSGKSSACTAAAQHALLGSAAAGLDDFALHEVLARACGWTKVLPCSFKHLRIIVAPVDNAQPVAELKQGSQRTHAHTRQAAASVL
jgi:hypothetical protein